MVISLVEGMELITCIVEVVAINNAQLAEINAKIRARSKV